MVYRILVAAAMSLLALSAHAAAVVPPAAIEVLKSGKPIDLIVEFESAEIDRAARSLRRPAETHDTPAISAYRSQRYRQTKDGVEAGLATAPAETRIEYSHLPMRLKRFRSVTALNAWAASSQVRAIHLDGELHRVLTHSLPLIEAPVVASGGYTGSGTTVAVIDDGIDYTNTAFGACSAPGVPASCRVAQSLLVGTATGTSDNSHGTNVSAIVAGVAPGARIAMLNAFSGTSAKTSDVIAGINWAIANRSTYNIASINMSLGDGTRNTAPCTSSHTNPFVTPVTNAGSAGITVVAAAGNEAYTNALSSPACVSGVVSVGAVYSNNWGGLNWGSTLCTDATTAADKVTCFSDSASFLTLLAPGALITAAGIQEGGTSQASPHVAGAVAVLRAAFPGESLAATLSRLTTNGVAVTDARNGLVKPRLDLLASARPANDNFSARSSLTGSSGTAGGSNLFATQESGESTLAAGAGKRTVWWKWTAPAAGQVTLDTHGSSIDTILAVYPAGSGVTGLLPVALNDNDGSSGGASGLLFMASAGVEYEIAIDGMGLAQGALTLNWSLNTAAAANLSITLNGPPAGTVGVNTDYTIAVANAGPQIATNVKVTLALPANVSYVSSSPACIQSGSSLLCDVGSMAAGSSLPLIITLNWTTAGTQTLTASVSSDLTDPVAGNNSASLAVTESMGGTDGDVPTLPQWATIILAGVLLWLSALKGNTGSQRCREKSVR